jgi:hypothetical protein
MQEVAAVPVRLGFFIQGKRFNTVAFFQGQSYQILCLCFFHQITSGPNKKCLHFFSFFTEFFVFEIDYFVSDEYTMDLNLLGQDIFSNMHQKSVTHSPFYE